MTSAVILVTWGVLVAGIFDGKTQRWRWLFVWALGLVLYMAGGFVALGRMWP